MTAAQPPTAHEEGGGLFDECREGCVLVGDIDWDFDGSFDLSSSLFKGRSDVQEDAGVAGGQEI